LGLKRSKGKQEDGEGRADWENKKESRDQLHLNARNLLDLTTRPRTERRESGGGTEGRDPIVKHSKRGGITEGSGRSILKGAGKVFISNLSVGKKNTEQAKGVVVSYQGAWKPGAMEMCRPLA